MGLPQSRCTAGLISPLDLLRFCLSLSRFPLTLNHDVGDEEKDDQDEVKR